MSRIGKQPIAVPAGVTVEVKGQLIKVATSSATLTWEAHTKVNVEFDSEGKQILVTRSDDDSLSRALHGTTRSLIANMIEGVTNGYKKELEVYGTGYGVKQAGQELELTVGTAKPFKLKIPAGVTIEITTPNARGNDTPAAFAISGADKQIVGQFAAKCKKVRPPEPYQGKGIRYKGERIVRKVGKAFGK